MKLIFKIIIFIFLGGIILIIGFFTFITYQTRSREKIIDEQFHKNGNIAIRKVEGYDCCEGFYKKTIIYDSNGRKIETYGNQDGSRFKELLKYQDSTVVFEGYYTIYNDSFVTANNFDVKKSMLSYLSETEYYSNRELKSEKRLSYFDEGDNRDTASLIIIQYDNTGIVTVNTEFRKDRDYINDEKSDRYTKLIQRTIIEDKINNSVDTIEIKKIKLE